jgi:hypothetical protein
MSSSGSHMSNHTTSEQQIHTKDLRTEAIPSPPCATVSNVSDPVLDMETLPEHTIVGLILSNGISRQDKYKCHVPSCSSPTFKRLVDMKRHYASRHDRHNARFWCPVDGCGRSIKCGGRAFPRKDKMIDHLERVHADKVGAWGE